MKKVKWITINWNIFKWTDWTCYPNELDPHLFGIFLLLLLFSMRQNRLTFHERHLAKFAPLISFQEFGIWTTIPRKCLTLLVFYRNKVTSYSKSISKKDSHLHLSLHSRILLLDALADISRNRSCSSSSNSNRSSIQ